MREQQLPMSNSTDLEDWEKVDDFLGNSTLSSSTVHEGLSSSTARQGQSRGHSTSRRMNVHKGTAVHTTAAAPAVMARSPKVIATLFDKISRSLRMLWNVSPTGCTYNPRDGLLATDNLLCSADLDSRDRGPVSVLVHGQPHRDLEA